MSSFYGGRPGNSFDIVATFGSVNAMVTQFRKGPNYTAVHYDEYVVIATIDSSDSTNGNVYKRGYNYTNSMGGAELIGNILSGAGASSGAELADIRIGYNETPYNSAGEAVREQVADLNNSLNEKFLIGKNKFNPKTVLLNYTLNTTDGTLVSAEGAMVSDKIWRHGAAYAIFSYLSSNGSHVPYMFVMVQYRADDSRISFSNSTGNGYDAGGAVELDNECAYIRFCTAAGSSFTNTRERIMVELSNGNTMSQDFEPYHMYLNPQISVKEGLAEELATLDELDKYFEIGKNVFNPETVTQFSYISPSDGQIYTQIANTFVSDRIPTNGAAKAIFSYLRTNGVQVLQAFNVFQYKANGEYIVGSASTENAVVTLDPLCGYIRFYASSNYTSKRARIMVELTDAEGAAAFSIFEKYQARFTPAVSVWRSAASVMSKLILSSGLKVKLIGDSITQGAQCSDFNTPETTGSIIIEKPNTADAQQWRYYTGTKSWAAKFKMFVESQYNATVTNMGLKGISTHQALYYWSASENYTGQLIDGDEDIVICMLGTNNRTGTDSTNFSYTKQSFYDELQKIKNALEVDGTEVIFMSAPPVSVSNESQSDTHFHMNDVDDVICKFACDSNMQYISLYKKTLSYMEETGTPLSDLLDNDGIHPNDTLHALMFRWVIDGLGLSRKIDGATW